MNKSRQEKLNDAMREHRRLRDARKPLITEYNRAHKELKKMNKQIANIGQAIYDLKQNGDTPEVTDHAIVRYLERIEKVNIYELKAKVATHKMARKEGNVIVTVNTDEETN